MFDLFWNVDTLYTINIRLAIIVKLNTPRRTEVLFLNKQLINKKILCQVKLWTVWYEN